MPDHVYVDLVVDDRSAADLAAESLAEWAALTGVAPETGRSESMLLEANATLAAPVLAAANRAPSQVALRIIGLTGLTRDPGAPGSTTVTFATSGGQRVEAPAGVRLRLPGGSLGAPAVVLVTTEALLVPAGSTAATVAAATEQPTSESNGTAVGTAAELLDRLTQVDSVALASAVAGGRDPETDEGYLGRGVTRLARLTETLVLPRQFAAAAAEDPRVGRAIDVDMFDPGQVGGPGDHPGHVTVAVRDPAAAVVAVEVRDEINADLDARSVAVLATHVIDATVVTVAVAVTVRRRPGFTDAMVKAHVETAVRELLDPLSYDGGPVVPRYQVGGVSDTAEGVARVESVTLDGAEADLALAGVAPLPLAGTVTVTTVAL